MPKLLKVRKRNASRPSKKQPAKTQASKNPSIPSKKSPRVSASSKTPSKKTNAQLKAEIEKILGEDFETLKEAQRALDEQSKPTTSHKFFKITNLSRKKKKNLAEVLQTIDDNATEIDKLKAPDESWGFRMFGNRSYEVFSNIDLLLNRIREYKSFAVDGAAYSKNATELVDNVYLIKWDRTPANWADIKRDEVVARQAKYERKKQREKKKVQKLEKEVKALRKRLGKGHSKKGKR